MLITVLLTPSVYLYPLIENISIFAYGNIYIAWLNRYYCLQWKKYLKCVRVWLSKKKKKKCAQIYGTYVSQRNLFHATYALGARLEAFQIYSPL